MNKLAVIVPFFKRPQLTSLCFQHLRRQAVKYDMKVFTAGSQGKESKALADKYGFNYIEIPNSPLSYKFNTLLNSAKGDFDGVVLLGSDDFLSDSVFDLYSEIDLKDPVLYGFNNFHFYSAKIKTLRTFKYKYRHSSSIGAGRLFSIPLLDKFEWDIWNTPRNSSLDSHCSNKVKGYEKVLPYTDVFGVDVKHNLNITSFARLAARTIPVSIRELHKLGNIATEIKKLR